MQCNCKQSKTIPIFCDHTHHSNPYSTHCDLYIFLQDFVEQRFIDAIHLEYQEKLDNALKRTTQYGGVAYKLYMLHVFYS